MGLFPEFGNFFIGYGSYHNDPINKYIHIICIPLIVSSLLAMFNHSGVVFTNPITSNPIFEINIAFIFVAVNSFVYLNVELMTGLISTCFYLANWVINNYLYQQAVENKMSNLHFKIALAIHIVCWIAQFIGHGVYEKRAPALLDNLLYTLVAPDFVIIEILFEFGYKKETYQRCKKQIEKNIAEFQNKRTASKKAS